MRRLAIVLGAGLLLPFALLFAMVGGVALTVGGQASAASCYSSPQGRAGINLNVAVAAYQAGVKAKASDRVLLAAFEAGLVESGMRILANDGRRGPEDSSTVTAADLAYAATSLALPHDGVGSDSDSVGPLQQRPAAGWGTVETLMNPALSFGLFYARAVPLDRTFEGSAGLLAAAIQHPAFKYQGRYDDQRVAATGLLGQVVGKAIDCTPGGTVSPVPAGWGTPGPCGLSPSTHYLQHQIRQRFGIQNIGGCAPFYGHVEDSDHYPDDQGQAHALDVMLGGDARRDAAVRARGDRIAAWLTTNHGPLNVRQIIWRGQIVTYDHGGSGTWAPCRQPGSSCAQLHFDHVHVGTRGGT